ncbi:MAG: NAD(+)/NADH kinase [Gracilibacteraceae bacterium]|jgi:NAD+ kinase|nr:NAD(+)/NADH kinase [Gracilibacteraceae bacterium]
MGNKVGFWINSRRVVDMAAIDAIRAWLAERDWQTLPDWQHDRTDKIEFLLSFGGDGTFLEAAREAAPYDIPVLGVNYGKLGFLCEVEQDGVVAALEKILRREFVVEQRLMLLAAFDSAQGPRRHVALNDVVFNRDLREPIVKFQVCLSGEAIASPPGDGLIVATPTGSTAYSLSAGGPVVSPDVEAILITPLAPHALSVRPMLVSAAEKITVTLKKGCRCHVTFDGGNQAELAAGETISIVKAPLKAKLLRLELRGFQRMVREKLRDR